MTLNLTSTPYFYLVASTVPKLQVHISIFLRCMQYLHHSALLNNGLKWLSIADVTMETKALGLV
jgi:hypothetical protein